MNLGAIGENLPLILAVIAVVLLQIFLRRRRRPEVKPQQIAGSLLSEVRLNLSLVETFSQRQKPRKFEMTSWQMNKTKLDFLDQSLQTTLSSAFTMVEDLNQRIEAAKKYKSTSYMAGVNIDKLREPLTKSKEGLEQWFLTHVGSKEPPPENPSPFDTLFGGRR